MASLEVEAVRGRLTDDVAAEILAFWSRHGALEGEAARQRLAEVVCVLRNSSGDVVGVNSVYADAVAQLAGRRMWRYRRFLAGGLPEDAEAAMIVATFAALAPEYEPEEDEPIGLCVLFDDPELLRRRPEAIWPDTKLGYLGYDADGRQIRARFFDGAWIA